MIFYKSKLPAHHPGRKMLVSELFDDMIMNDIPETSWKNYIQDKLFNYKSDTVGKIPSTLRFGSQSSRECYF